MRTLMTAMQRCNVRSLRIQTRAIVTLVAILVTALTLLFRGHSARVRHGLWLTASLKFNGKDLKLDYPVKLQIADAAKQTTLP